MLAIYIKLETFIILYGEHHLVVNGDALLVGLIWQVISVWSYSGEQSTIFYIGACQD